jgi:hypothetical protein
VRRRRPKLGDVVQVALPSGRFAYGRVLQDASVAFYDETTTEPCQPPIGSRSYQFVVGVYEDVLRSDRCPIVGRDPSANPEEDWPPPYKITDPISGSVKIYHKGTIRPMTEYEHRSLEPAAVWDYTQIVERLEKSLKTD